MTTGKIKYQRVAMRLRERFKDKEFSKKDLEDPIFIECGTDPRTVKVAIEMMLRLELIKKKPAPREFGVMPEERYEMAQKQDEEF